MRWASLVALLLMVPLAAACGAGKEVSSAVVSDAAAKTIDAKSSRYAITTSIDLGDKEVSFGGGGVFDYERDRGAISIDVSPLARLSGESVGDGNIEVRFDGLVYYMRLPGEMFAEEGIPQGKWLRIDMGKVDQASGLELGSMTQTEQNPAKLLRFLRSTGAEVSEVGEDTVRSVSTTHYRTTVDLQRLTEASSDLADLPEKARRQMRAEVENLMKEAGIREIPVNIWLDADGLLRRITMEYELKAESERARMLTTVELYDFGVPVEVSQPLASETVDLTRELMPAP